MIKAPFLWKHVRAPGLSDGMHLRLGVDNESRLLANGPAQEAAASIRGHLAQVWRSWSN
jgi:hypothetical protein